MKKRLKKAWRALFGKQYVLPTVEGTDQFLIRMIEDDPDNTSLAVALGITEERENILKQKIEEAYKLVDQTTRNVIDVSNMVAPLCKHINEFYFANVIICEIQFNMQRPRIIHAVIGGNDK